MRDCVIDSKDALRYISKHKEELGVDPDRFFVMGHSAGGQIAQLVLLSSPESLLSNDDEGELAEFSYRMIAGVSWYGPVNFEDVSLFNHDDRPNFRDRFGPRILYKDSTNEDKTRLYKEMGSINYLCKDSPPMLIIHGDKDTTIPVKHAYCIEQKAKELDANVEIMFVKNAGHNWRPVDDGAMEPPLNEIIEKTVSFLKSHL
eukprot:13404047-Ditylum_brightwellii.AAC.1